MYIDLQPSVNIKCISSARTPNILYSITPDRLYYCKTIINDISVYDFRKIFYFTDEVIQNSLQIERPYISVHVRQGDKYLENQKGNVCTSDVRPYSEETLFNLIEKLEGPILFLAESLKYKKKIKEKYSNVVITEYDIGHTGLHATTDQQVLNSITDFYLLSQSEHIHALSYSGFAWVAAMFNNVPITKYY